MKHPKQKRFAFFLCIIVTFVIYLAFLFGIARSSNNQIAIGKKTDFILNPDPDNGYTHDPNEVYNHILFKIRPYKNYPFRLALRLYMDDETDLWIYYKTTSEEPFQDYEGGGIHIGLDTALLDGNSHIIDLDINLDLESFIVSELRAIKEVEMVGERFDLYYIVAYRELDDGSRSIITIDNFNEPGQDLAKRGWESTTMDQFRISFDSSYIGYLKAKYTPETDPNATTTQEPIYPYNYIYPYGGAYYGSTLYGGGYYGGTSYYGSTGYYGGGYYGSGYYGSGYYGGGYYGGGYYGGGYYGGGYYGGLGGYYGGLYGGGLMGLYGGLYGGLSTYYGGPIGLWGGLSGLFI